MWKWLERRLAAVGGQGSIGHVRIGEECEDRQEKDGMGYARCKPDHTNVLTGKAWMAVGAEEIV